MAPVEEDVLGKQDGDDEGDSPPRPPPRIDLTPRMMPRGVGIEEVLIRGWFFLMASELAELVSGEADKDTVFSGCVFVAKVSCTIESSSSDVGESFSLGTRPGRPGVKPLPLPSEVPLPLDSRDDGVVIVNVGPGEVVEEGDNEEEEDEVGGGEAKEKAEEVEVVGVELSERRREIAEAMKPPFVVEGSDP